jgi:hypothetical protein
MSGAGRLGSEDVGRQLGMSPEWVRRQVQAGRLRARVYLVGGRNTYRFDQMSVDEFVARYSAESRGDGMPVELELLKEERPR